MVGKREEEKQLQKNEVYWCNYILILLPPWKSPVQQTPKNRLNNSLCTELWERKTRIYITECPFKQINVKVNNQGQITVKVNKTHFGSRSITQRIFQNNGFSAHKARCNSKILRIHKSKPPPSELESQLEIGIRNIKERELYQKVRESN